jgi:hypothetical protein
VGAEIAALERELIELGTSRDVLKQTRDAVRSAVNVAQARPEASLDPALPAAPAEPAASTPE